ncbi:thioredoxin [Candidatus Woesearchaeota archaeon]|nr:thioredoxin [Candidatus Woesearchaeota archaeon]
MLELNKDNFEKELKENKILILDAWAIWCSPCKATSPIFEELSKEIKNVKFAKLNVDDNTEIASKLGIMSIPTFIVFKNGKEVERIIGANPKSVMKAKFEAGIK